MNEKALEDATAAGCSIGVVIGLVLAFAVYGLARLLIG